MDMMNGGKTRKNNVHINWDRKWKLPINVETEKVYLLLTICRRRHH